MLQLVLALLLTSWSLHLFSWHNKTRLSWKPSSKNQQSVRCWQVDFLFRSPVSSLYVSQVNHFLPQINHLILGEKK